MGGYKTVVVGTDGSASSLRAVERAGALASGASAATSAAGVTGIFFSSATVLFG